MEDGVAAQADIQKSVEFLAEIEECGEEVLCYKQELIELDRKENQNRECLRAMKTATEGKVWTCFGTTFAKMPLEDARQIIEEDQKRIVAQKEKTRKELRDKVEKLHKLEGLPAYSGFHLKGITLDDLGNIAGPSHT